MSGGDGSQIHIGEKTRKNKHGRVHGNKPETGLTEEEKSSDYLRSLLKTHRKELPPNAFHHVAVSICQVLAQLRSRSQHKLTQIWSKTATREALIKSKSFRERFWKNPQVSRWGFQATPHYQPLLEVTPGQLGFAHQRGSGSSHPD